METKVNTFLGIILVVVCLAWGLREIQVEREKALTQQRLELWQELAVECRDTRPMRLIGGRNEFRPLH